jgi:hypothetical protein
MQSLQIHGYGFELRLLKSIFENFAGYILRKREYIFYDRNKPVGAITARELLTLQIKYSPFEHSKGSDIRRLIAHFVANVNVNSDDHLKVNVNRFENSNVWNAGNRHRLVVPQLVFPTPVHF